MLEKQKSEISNCKGECRDAENELERKIMEEIKYERAYSVLPSGGTRGDYRRERCATRNRIRKKLEE